MLKLLSLIIRNYLLFFIAHSFLIIRAEGYTGYFYYPHGPLARAELGDIKVQAVDYAYTIQGWLKGVNSNTLRPRNDIGQDGLVNTVNVRIPADAYGYSLNYFRGDYTPAGGTTDFIASTASLDLSKTGPDLYNGNISSMVTTLTSIDPLNDSLLGQPIPQLTAYRYDQLNRIKQLQAYHNINLAGNAWLSSGNDNRYASSYTYDGNGNLQTVNRHDNTGATMDSTTYVYENKANGYDRETNKLRQVRDAAPDTVSLEDIDNQQANNYTYDEIGQLIGDVAEGIASITWFADHKPWKVTRVDTSSLSDLEFKYDAMGNRIAKIVKPAASKSDTTTWETTWYVRDAQGELLATYDQTDSTFKTSERMLYGSSMLGVNTDAVDLLATPDTSFIGLTVGLKRYHLKNHLGNVNMVVTDKRVFNSDSVFRADVLLTNDFYPFGSEMQGGRSIEANLAQYGFNGMRMDNEIAGTGNSYTTKFRQYDPRLGRFLSPDPKMKSLPGWSPYVFSFNNPVRLNDPKGDCPPGVDCNKVVNPLDKMQIRVNRASNLSIPSRNPGTPNEYTHTGWDLHAPIGTNVKNVYAGEVVDVYSAPNSTTSYGTSITVAHYRDVEVGTGTFDESGNEITTTQREVAFYSFYSHLSTTSVQEGDALNAGDIIGETGISGNASSFANSPADHHLHFEVGTGTYTTGAGRVAIAASTRISPNEVLPTNFFKNGQGQASSSGVGEYDKTSNTVKTYNYTPGNNSSPVKTQSLHNLVTD